MLPVLVFCLATLRDSLWKRVGLQAEVLALRHQAFRSLAGDIWKSAERLRGKFKAYEDQSVILPIIVIRRLECVLIAWREKREHEVLAKRPNMSAKDLSKLVKVGATRNSRTPSTPILAVSST